MHRLYEASIGDEVCVETLSSGCELYIYPLRGARETHILLTLNFGSIDRYYATSGSSGLRSAPAGVAHFIEHRLFEKPDGDITERFNELGSDVDAQTSFTNTEYSTTFSDRLESNAALLLETALEPHFTDEGIDRERTRTEALEQQHVHVLPLEPAFRGHEVADRPNVAVEQAQAPQPLRGHGQFPSH